MLWGEKTAKIKVLIEKGKLGQRECEADRTLKRMPEAVGFTGEGVDVVGLRIARSDDACGTQDDFKQQPS